MRHGRVQTGITNRATHVVLVVLIGLAGIGTGKALAATGGLPLCMKDLSTCHSSNQMCNSSLSICDSDLSTSDKFDHSAPRASVRATRASPIAKPPTRSSRRLVSRATPIPPLPITVRFRKARGSVTPLMAMTPSPTTTRSSCGRPRTVRARQLATSVTATTTTSGRGGGRPASMCVNPMPIAPALSPHDRGRPRHRLHDLLVGCRAQPGEVRGLRRLADSERQGAAKHRRLRLVNPASVRVHLGRRWWLHSAAPHPGIREEGNYWSSSVQFGILNNAFQVSFFFGLVDSTRMPGEGFVRAVRGGP